MGIRATGRTERTNTYGSRLTLEAASSRPTIMTNPNKKVISAANGATPSPVLNNLIVSGDKAYLAGVLGTDESGKLVSGGVKAETVQALKNAEDRLRHAGLDLSDGRYGVGSS